MSNETRSTPLWKEDHISQIPALQLLQKLGWEYLTPKEALALRQDRKSTVLLDGILTEQLRKRRFLYRGQEHPFSEGNIHSAIQAMKDVLYDGLVRTNEKIYDLLCLGKSMQQSVSGDTKSFTLQYIDWHRPERNVYHVTEEYSVERSGSRDTYRPDIVLFVNGIPLVVIECKRPELGPGKDPIKQAISQHLRNQKENGIPKLFQYVQMAMSVSMNDAKYATCSTPLKFWSKWKERDATDEPISELINQPLLPEQKNKLFGDRFAYVRDYFDALEVKGREVTEQDRTIWALCRPERVLELSFMYVLFDAGQKKIARYQQYFCVQNIMQRIAHVEGGRRKGGVVWHTQGSGKSLTMVILAKSIALEERILDHKVVLVTDRIDLDDQIYKTFKHCGIEPEQATTGANLVSLLRTNKQRVVTTVINKFEAAVGKSGVTNPDHNIFVLVDEGHRTQFGSLHAKMKKVLPNACFIAFTGTPLMKRDRSTIDRFGGLIRPPYTIRDAVDDEAVVPLLYEGRHVREKVDERAIDEWFSRITENLTDEQKADLKRKFSSEDMLMRAEPVVREIAWDINTHFRDNWQNTPFKAQLVAPRKETALQYKQFLDEFTTLKSEVLMSGPDEREGEEELYGENTDPLNRFWKTMMDRYGTEKEYNRQIINAFKYGNPSDPEEEAPEIIIVVDKLLTGFDAPCNTVLYLCRKLTGHTLLQAIARVNRLHDGKDFGYIIDYRGVLENLDHALDVYSALPEFEREELAGTLTDVDSITHKLPQKHSVLWDTFRDVRNTRDQEEYERLLADDALRVRFYERFSDFARTFGIALSTVTFIEETPEKKVDEYRRDLKFFKQLRYSVRRRYAEVIDFSEYEPKIRKLLDTHLGAEEVEVITGAIDLFNKEERQQALSEATSDAAKADTIASNTARVLEVKWKKEDPAFYKKFSRMLKDVIEAFREGRIKALQYLQETTSLMNSVINRSDDDIPKQLRDHDIAKAYYGSIKDILVNFISDTTKLETPCADVALAIENIVEDRRIVNWTDNDDVKNRMRQDIDDYLYDFMKNNDIDISFEDIDLILDECLEIAKARRP